MLGGKRSASIFSLALAFGSSCLGLKSTGAGSRAAASGFGAGTFSAGLSFVSIFLVAPGAAFAATGGFEAGLAGAGSAAGAAGFGRLSAGVVSGGWGDVTA